VEKWELISVGGMMNRRGEGEEEGGSKGGNFEGEFSLHLFPNETRILSSQWRKLELSDLRGNKIKNQREPQKG
jgi:hypothetical protein